jgi:hypothetical protein
MIIPLYTKGMHDWILNEMELGSRVAHFLDIENWMGWTFIDDLLYQRYVDGEGEGAT